MSGVTPEQVRELLDNVKHAQAEYNAAVWRVREDRSGPMVSMTAEQYRWQRLMQQAETRLSQAAPALAQAYLGSEEQLEALTLERDRLAHELRLLREVVETASGHQLAHLVGAPLPVHGTDLGTHRRDDQHPHQHLYAALHRSRGEEGDQDGATDHQSNLAQGTPDQAPQGTAGDQDEGQCGDATQPQGKRHMLPSRDVLRGHRGVVTDALLSDDTPERSSEDVQLTQGVPGHPEHEDGCCAPERRFAPLTRTPGDRHLVQGSAHNHQGDGEIGNVPADGIRAAATRLDQGVEQGRNDRIPEGRDSRQHVCSIETTRADRCPE